MSFKSVDEVYDSIKGSVDKEARSVTDEAKLRSLDIDNLIYGAVFGATDDVKRECRKIITEAAKNIGIYSESIQSLYDGFGRGEVSGFTVPAINIRGLTYDTARAVFRSAAKLKAGAFIFEIAKSEIGYTEQRPAEYTTAVIAAAVKEGYVGPVFIQGDHFQINAAKYNEDPKKEVESLKELIKEGIEGGFYNIDIDASTLVDLSKETVKEQQRPNFEVTEILTEYIRTLEPEGVTISVGGEIGEVGKKNSNEEELRAFMDGLLAKLNDGRKGISKISIQTGTAHGGVVLPDGSIASVKVDFDTIEALSKVAQGEYKIGGVVQHGASTLPDEAFHIFPERGAVEIHLATGFQNIVYASKSMPAELRDRIDKHLIDAHGSERKDGETEEQFIYKTRKKGFGPFKKEFWDIAEDKKKSICKELEDRFDLLFRELKAIDNISVVRKYFK